MRRESRKEARRVVNDFRESGMDITLEETPDTVTVVLKTKEGTERRRGFMRIGGLGEEIRKWVENPVDPEIEEALRKIAEAEKNKPKEEE